MNQCLDILSCGLRDGAGAWLSNGTVTVYDAGTTKKLPVYSDFDLTNQLDNPLTLNAGGKVLAFTNKRVKLLVKDSDGRFSQVIDNVNTADSDLNATITGRDGLPGDGTSLDANEKLTVNLDGTTLGITENSIQLKDGGISTGKFASESVTRTKMQDVNINFGAYVSAIISNTGNQIVSGLTCTLTTTGRPVFVCLLPGPQEGSGLAIDTRFANIWCAFLMDGVEICRQSLKYVPNGGASSSETVRQTVPVSIFKMIHTPDAGVHVYTFNAGYQSAKTFTNVRMVAYEL